MALANQPNDRLGRVEPLEFDQVRQVVTHVSESERHFNTIEAGHRKLASTWLLGVFAAAGFILTRQPNSLPVTLPALTAVLCVFGVAGVTMLWLMDIHVYHQLLDAYFEQGLLLESNTRGCLPFEPG